MINKIIYRSLVVAFIALMYSSCVPMLVQKTENTIMPERFLDAEDTINSAKIAWKDYFTDPYLNALIDTALHNNQELNIILQEIEIANNEVQAKKGEYLPYVDVVAGAGVDKVARYTSKGASEATTDIEPGMEMPDPLPDYLIGVYATWELDVWKKLRNAKKASYMRFLSTVEGKNFMVTNLITEIANSYYELLALDNQLVNVQTNIELLTNALSIVKLQKEAARVTELAVRRFEAEVLKNQSRQFYLLQDIVETENRINFLVGRYPRHIDRDSEAFNDLVPKSIQEGIPSQLLVNRPDIRQAEMEIAAAKLDVAVAKTRFYPSVGISASLGFQAFNPGYLFRSPESLLFSFAGDLAAPLFNRKAIKSMYYSANSKQIQAIYSYEQTILKAYIEVANQLSLIRNLESSYLLKAQQVEALNQSITISTVLFRSARADYMEVLLTQRDALESQFELIETKKQQLNAWINVYQALGGGWN